MVHRQNLSMLPTAKLVNNPVPLNYDLTNLVPANFWNDAAQPRELTQKLRCLEDAKGKQLTKPRRVAADEPAHRFQVIKGLVCPSYFSQWAMRLRASS
jgi:hypothetical protein